MKKYISHLFRLHWICTAFLLAALTSRGQQFWNGDFDVSITLGCNCTCFCTNDMSTNNPVSAFLAANPFKSYHATTKMGNNIQWIPPHLTEFLGSCTPPDYDNGNIAGLAGEGWTRTVSISPSEGLVQNNVTPAFSLSNPIQFNLPYSFYADKCTPAPGQPIGDLPLQNATELTECQPYPWDVNVYLTLANGQTYSMEQQLAVGLEPLYYGDPVEPTVNYIETNGLINVSIYCNYGNMTNRLDTTYALITAILLTNNIPSPYDPTVGWNGSLDIYTNWTWPLDVFDMTETPPSSYNNDPGAAGTYQAQVEVAGYVENQPLLVRANRAYELVIDYGVPCYGGLTYSNEPQLVITNTGIIPPCTNVNFVFYTTNCDCSNSPASYCEATNTGQVDMLGVPDAFPGITVWANGGYNTTLAVPGTFNLAVTLLNPGPANFSKWATECLGTNTAYEYFRSPFVSVSDQCDKTLNMSNDFVMCPSNPAIVLGTVTLNGCVDTNYYGGAGALSFLVFAVTNNSIPGLPYDPVGDPNDPSGGQDLTLSSVSSIQANGGESAPGAPVYTAGNGYAAVGFDNPGAFTSPNTFTGDYTLKLAGLDSGECYWDVGDLHLVFGSPVNLTYDIYSTATNLDITCGDVYSRNFTYCFGLVTIPVTNTWPSLPIPANDIWTQAVLQVSGTALDGSYNVGTFTIHQAFSPATPNVDVANVQMFLPEGNYQYSTTIYTANGEEINFNTINYFSVTNVCCSPTPPCSCVTPPTNMVLWLPFDEPSGSTAINLAPGGINGTKIGAPGVVLGAYVDNSLNFDATNEYVTVPDYPAIEIGSNDLTIDAWVNRATNDSDSPPSVIVDKRDVNSGVGYNLSISYGALVLSTTTGNYQDIGARIVPPDGLWHFVAASVSQSTGQVLFYIDGTNNSIVPLTPVNLSNSNALWVAGSQYGDRFGTDQHWIGDIDEVEIYNRALSDGELSAIYNAGPCGKCKSSCLFEVDCPSNIVVLSCTNPVQVQFPEPTVTDTCCGTNDLHVQFIPSSGAYFSPNTTNNVKCIVSDDCGNTNICGFTVTVTCETGPGLGIGNLGNHTSIIYWNQALQGGNYVLQYSTNLNSTNWFPVTNYIPITGGVLSNTVPVQFYRLYSNP